MNWLDWVLLAVFAIAAFKGFSRGFIVEVGSLVALVAGVWAGVHVSDRVVDAIGLETESAALAFLVTFLLVLLVVHLIAKLLTAMVDLAQLSLPNKLSGIGFGVLRSAFTMSIVLNLLAGSSDGSLPPAKAREGSMLFGPVRSFAPLIIPSLGETKWLLRTMDRIQEEAREMGL